MAFSFNTPSGKPRRIVITGMGAVTPVGLTARESWNAVLEGRSGVAAIAHYDPKDCSTRFAAEVKGFDVTRSLGPFYPRGHESPPVTQAANVKEARRVGRFVHLALAAGLDAYADSGLDQIRDQLNATRIGTAIGVGMGGLPEIEETHFDLINKGYKRISPFFIPQVIANLASGQLSILLAFQGPNVCHVSACASSSHAIGEAAWMIARGDADIMFAGGAEAVVSPLGVGGFAAMRALSTHNENPACASRPFDRDRDGFVIGEGAGVLVLEELEHARARGAKIYAEVLGYGLSGDAYHLTSPAPGGEGGARAMAMALKQSGLRAEQIDYVNAHGTSTPAGDVEEAKAIARLLTCDSSGAPLKRERRLQVSSTKSMTGHLLGAAGAVEAIFTALSVHEGVVPPTINLDNLDSECAGLDMDFTPHRAVRMKVRYALTNSFGFGGTNASLILGEVI